MKTRLLIILLSVLMSALLLFLYACNAAHPDNSEAPAASESTTDFSASEQSASSSEPEASEPEVSEPETSEPEVSEPEVSEPETSEPEVSEPEVSEPETSEPEVSEPETSEPEKIVPSSVSEIAYGVGKPEVYKVTFKNGTVSWYDPSGNQLSLNLTDDLKDYKIYSYYNGAFLAENSKTHCDFKLFKLDGNEYDEIPVFTVPLRRLEAGYIAGVYGQLVTINENGTDKSYYLERTALREFKLVPYGYAEKKAAEDKYKESLVGIYNSFTAAFWANDTDAMNPLAAEGMLYRVSRFKNPSDTSPLPEGMTKYDISALGNLDIVIRPLYYITEPEEWTGNRTIALDEMIFSCIDDSEGGISTAYYSATEDDEYCGYWGVTVSFVCDGNGGFKVYDICFDPYTLEENNLMVRAEKAYIAWRDGGSLE